jgi:hypothetical protein
VTANADVAHTLIMFLRPGLFEVSFFSSQSTVLLTPPSAFVAALLDFHPVMLISSSGGLLPLCRKVA